MSQSDRIASSESARTLARPQRRRFDAQKWTALAIDSPCAVLMSCGANLVILLAKSRQVTSHGELLDGLRVVTIPNGLRLRLLELRAGLGVAHLPDEWLYMKALIRRRGGQFRLIIDGDERATSPERFPIVPLTASQYQRLLSCTGRVFRAQVVAMFEQWLPRSVVMHRRWTWPRVRGLFARPARGC